MRRFQNNVSIAKKLDVGAIVTVIIDVFVFVDVNDADADVKRSSSVALENQPTISFLELRFHKISLLAKTSRSLLKQKDFESKLDVSASFRFKTQRGKNLLR